MVRDLGRSKLSYYLAGCVNAAVLSPRADAAVFFARRSLSSVRLNAASMPAYEAYAWGGDLVCCDFDSARESLSFPGPKSRHFYLWDLEWTRRENARTYREWASVYRDGRLRFIARSHGHARAFASAWGVEPAGVVDDFDWAQLSALLS